MELDVRLNNESLSLAIENPFRLDIDALDARIREFLAAKGVRAEALDIRGLLPRMVKGIAGCEAGCPADALSVVKKGHHNFTLNYIEGGILSASAQVGQGHVLSIKLFPEF